MARKLYWLVIALLVLGAGYLALRYSGGSGLVPSATVPSTKSLPPLPVKTPEALHGDWKARIGEILAAYDGDKKADSARDQIELVRVGAQDRDVHLQLFLAFRALAAGETGADAKVTAARDAFKKL